MKTTKKKTSKPPEIGLGDLLSVLSVLSKLNRADDESEDRPVRRARFEIPEFGPGTLVILMFILAVLFSVLCYIEEAERDRERTYYKIAEAQEYASPTKKQTAALIKDTLFKDYSIFKDEYAREFCVYDDYCTVEYNGELLAGMSLENAILWNQKTLGIYDSDALQSFIEASKAAVGG